MYQINPVSVPPELPLVDSELGKRNPSVSSVFDTVDALKLIDQFFYRLL